MAILVLSACGNDDVVDKYRKLLDFFTDNKIGENGDYGVFKAANSGLNEPVIAVFGYANNLEVCTEFVRYLERQEPNRYHCEPLQKP